MRSAGASSLMTILIWTSALYRVKHQQFAACYQSYASFNPCFNDRQALW